MPFQCGVNYLRSKVLKEEEAVCVLSNDRQRGRGKEERGK